MKPNFETRLDELREEARANGTVTGRGVNVAGGPIPVRAPSSLVGYNGEGVVRPPVWTWEIPVYFFVGGMGGMAGIIACGAWLAGDHGATAAAIWIAFVASLISPVLLILDLGRPRLFFNMLRIFKWTSPMSVGAWVLSAFGAHAFASLVAFEVWNHHWLHDGWQTLVLGCVYFSEMQYVTFLI